MKSTSNIVYLICSMGVGAACTFVFILMALTKSVYVYENKLPILYTELFLAAAFTAWGIYKLARTVKGE